MAPAPAPAEAYQPPQSPGVHLLVVSGIGGAPAYVDAFYDWGATLVDAARERFRIPPASIHFLAEDPARDPTRIDARSTADQVERVLLEIAERAGPRDRVVVVLFGHGSARGDESRFNVPGPDLTAADFDALLERFPTQTIAFVNSSSASGGFIDRLSGPNRVVVTATRSPRERNAARFGEYFVEAVAGGGADVDKDGRISLLEAFEYARLEVARVYEEEGLLLSEHALLDDDGDGTGSEEPAAGAGDGELASRVFFGAAGAAPVAAAPADATPELRALYERKSALEGQIAALRTRRDSLDPERYRAELEELLVQLALTDRAIREFEGGSP